MVRSLHRIEASYSINFRDVPFFRALVKRSARGDDDDEVGGQIQQIWRQNFAEAVNL